MPLQRVVGVKKAVSVACGDDHTLVLQAASLPALLYEDAFLPLTSAQLTESHSSRSSSDPTSALGLDDSMVEDGDNGDVSPHTAEPAPLKASTCHHVHHDAVVKETTKVLSLQQLCQREVAKQVNLRTALPLLSLAYSTGCIDLMTYCYDFIRMLVVTHSSIACIDKFTFLLFYHVCYMCTLGILMQCLWR